MHKLWVLATSENGSDHDMWIPVLPFQTLSIWLRETEQGNLHFGSGYYCSYFIDTGSREVRLLAQGHTAGQWQKQDTSLIGPKALLLYSASDTSWKGLGL